MERELKAKVTKSVRAQTIFQRAYACAVYGAMAWTVYAIVECCFSSILTWFFNPSYDYVPLHWGLTALLFVIYPLIGLIIGGLFGISFIPATTRISLFMKVKPLLFYPAISTLILIIAFDVNLVINYLTSPVESLGLSELPLLFISLLMIFGLVLSTSSVNWFMRLRFLTNPWTASVALLGLPWIHNELLFSYSTIVNAVGALAYVAMVFFISFVVQKIMQTRPTNRFTTGAPAVSAKSIISLAIAVFIVFGISLILKQTPFRDNSTPGASPDGLNLPNIILITMDTVRADHLSLYGYKRDTTPNLRKFSKDAILYTRAIASGDMTLSTHASIFSGMYARQHGSHLDPWNGYPTGRPLAEKFNTLAEVLSEKGHLTAGIVANYTFLSHSYRLNQGFQYYDNRSHVPFLGLAEPYYMRLPIRDVFVHFAPREAFDMRCHRAEKINQEIFSFLDKTKKDDRPFFLFINYMDAHEPYMPPPPYDTLYPGKDNTFTSERYFQLVKEVIKLERKVTKKERNHLVSQYDGEIAYLDSQIGELFAQLAEFGLYENTLIIVTSDHGEAFGERDLFNHGVSAYQDQVFIPLVVKYPNSREGRNVDKLVSVVDLMPTILEVSGYDPPANVNGQSLLKIDENDSRSVISESFPSGHLRTLHPRFDRIERSIFLGPYKLISSTNGKKELYNLIADSDEATNIYQSGDGISMELEKRLNQWIKNTTREVSTSSEKLDSETLRRLKSLGYIK